MVKECPYTPAFSPPKILDPDPSDDLSNSFSRHFGE
jgi:hypothetical protein